MKKSLYILLVIVILFFICSCGNTQTTAETNIQTEQNDNKDYESIDEFILSDSDNTDIYKDELLSIKIPEGYHDETAAGHFQNPTIKGELCKDDISIVISWFDFLSGYEGNPSDVRPFCTTADLIHLYSIEKIVELFATSDDYEYYGSSTYNDEDWVFIYYGDCSYGTDQSNLVTATTVKDGVQYMLLAKDWSENTGYNSVPPILGAKLVNVINNIVFPSLEDVCNYFDAGKAISETGIKWQETPDSSAFSRVGYDETNHRLGVSFRSTGTYYYEDFSLEDWNKFISADSLGSYFNKYIKGNYPYSKG